MTAPSWCLALDVWMALGHPPIEFGDYCERQDRSWPTVWANLLASVSEPTSADHGTPGFVR